ncbi:MAG: GNAT family N-acetyltransferase [Gemmatimonadetes bacterium]|nr:GNAT family N-acetyltransferase [Gemmatimonadota bacterium]NIQ52541.1 GNAT family N-acetyltransferase [Gemmatimonadota bacterium]NIU72679.1 GNAT family N-acetyltransferase [Gammaproteobacteria bacterium]NIX43085.1 GNAT family N-acetyltransferase [Gemmatimonadota bacterium]NIY07247.1 GNAT family N-acetyltransferase [Gemmatimonadota bacterium]
MTGSATLRPMTGADLPAVERLLESEGLPTVGVAEWLEQFVVAERDGRIEGVAGLEVHDGDGVLRSVAVARASRSRGLGARLTSTALASARRSGLRRVYLLTTTAVDYFPRHGFRRIDRAEASPAVRASVEFREACPDSAVAMVLELE